uniref:Calponin-homology (CH) domain-containing protein n=1 Tax=Macrostomum lignano TaxID=282301 RepID=A0A1I8GI37_9PLAT
LSEVLPDQAAAGAATVTSDVAVRDYLLDWCSKSLSDYPDLRLDNFSACWSDGRAFLYLIHRFRPNLVDPSRIPAMSAEERLRLAFALNERHLGVSSLLDPEDVNMPEPDERSLITYVSSIYDVVAEHRTPQQRQRQPLGAASGASIGDSSWEEYRRSALELLTWLRQSISSADLVGRDLTSGLSQMRAIAERFEAQRRADAEQRMAQKSALVRRYDELLSGVGNVGSVRIEPELRPDQLERAWERYNLAVNERERALQQRIAKLERLYKLGDSVRNEASEAEAQVRAIASELQSLSPDAHPMDAERALRGLTSGLSEVGQRVDKLFNQVQELREEQYSQAEHLYHRLCSLHLSLLGPEPPGGLGIREAGQPGRFRRHAEQLLQQGSTSAGGVGSGFYDEVASVSQAFSSSPAYADLRRCMAWIRQREEQLRRSQQPPAGADVAAVHDIAELLRRLSASVIQQRAQIDACESARAGLSAGEERETFDRLLGELDAAYRALLQAANRRLAETEELLAFMESAEAEVAWLAEKESEVLGHDWGSSGLDTDDVEIYFK